MDRKRRIFSESFRRDIVSEAEKEGVNKQAICREYSISSATLYKWIYQYGKKYQKGVRMVLEKESESYKKIDLEKKIAELERLLGKKQIEIEYLNKVIEEGDKLLGGDLKKKFAPKS